MIVKDYNLLNELTYYYAIFNDLHIYIYMKALSYSRGSSTNYRRKEGIKKITIWQLSALIQARFING